MNNNLFPINKKKKSRAYSYRKPQRSLQTQKKKTQSKEIHKTNHKSQIQILKTQVKACVEALPMNEQFIQHYIQELKQKLSALRNTPKKKYLIVPENLDILKRRRSIQMSKQKIKAKSVERLINSRYNTKSMNFINQNKLKQLHNLNQVRKSFKRYKQHYNSSQRRLSTEKNKHRYADDYQENKNEIENIAKNKMQSSLVRFRSNTEEVIHSANNPARIYRHSSLKKHNQEVSQNGHVFNSFFFDKIISVNQNIHIIPKSKEQIIKKPIYQQKQKEQGVFSPKNKRNQDKNYRNYRQQKVPQTSNEKIGDLSTINAKKQTINFLGDSCLFIKQELRENKHQKAEQILDFIGWRTKELKNAFLNGKKKQKKNGLEKLSKIFPKGFFS